MFLSQPIIIRVLVVAEYSKSTICAFVNSSHWRMHILLSYVNVHFFILLKMRYMQEGRYQYNSWNGIIFWRKCLLPLVRWAINGKEGKGFPLQAWCGSRGSRRLRLLDHLDIRHYEGGKVVTLTHRPSLPRGVFLVLICRGWVNRRAHGSVSSFWKKSPVTPLGIDPETLGG
jgi:hypothetical protein